LVLFFSLNLNCFYSIISPPDEADKPDQAEVVIAPREGWGAGSREQGAGSREQGIK
jgi:hypothetical protein